MKQKENNVVDKKDYIEFCHYFGNNIDIYMRFKDFVHQNEISWKEFSDIKYGDFNNSYITIPKKENINVGGKLVALAVTNFQYDNNALADLFCSVYNEGMDEIVGVLFVRNTLRENIESWVVVKQFDESNKYDDIVIAKFLKKYNIAVDDMNIEVVNLPNGIDSLKHVSLRNGKMFWILNFYEFSEYKKQRLLLINNYQKEVRKRIHVRKKYESQLESMSSEKFNQLYNSLNLSYNGINRKEYLKFYMYYGDDLRKYACFLLKFGGSIPKEVLNKKRYSLLNKKYDEIRGPKLLSDHELDLER